MVILQDGHTDLCGAGKGDHLHAGVFDEQIPDCAAPPDDHIEHAGRQPGCVEAFGDDGAGQRRVRRGLQNKAVADGKRVGGLLSCSS